MITIMTVRVKSGFSSTLEGVFGNVLYYKGFTCSVQLRYSFGAGCVCLHPV